MTSNVEQGFNQDRDMSTNNSVYLFEPFKVIEVKCRGGTLPRPRSGHRIACDDKYIYCFGGYNPSLPINHIQRNNPTWTRENPLFKELWRYCIASKKWKELKVIDNMPEELASNAMCMHGGHLLIFGGTGAPFGNKCSNDLLTWCASSESSRLHIPKVTGAKPPGQYGQSILCHDGYLYTVGGTNGFAYSCDIYRIDLRSLEWEPIFIATGKEDEPLGRYRHEITRIDNKIFIIGGGTGEWAFELMEVPVFDLEKKTWTIEIPKADDTMTNTLGPLPRKCHSAVQLDTPSGAQVFVAGGTDGQSIFDDVWRLNVSNFQWNLMQKTVLPNPLYFHSSTITTNGCMYVFGGIEPKENPACRNNSLYKVWLCIPKLSEICWEALLSMYPSLDHIDENSLIKIGIPRHFVQRLK